MAGWTTVLPGPAEHVGVEAHRAAVVAGQQLEVAGCAGLAGGLGQAGERSRLPGADPGAHRVVQDDLGAQVGDVERALAERAAVRDHSSV
jgi:hypothetical protein